ncbi:hypothetical protein Tco_0212269 [Tanacetum coccineum]
MSSCQRLQSMTEAMYFMARKQHSSKRSGTLRYSVLGGLPERVGDEAVHEELGDKMERAATIASSLEAE